MNWLAHLLLSEEDVESRIGNILADVVKGKARKALSPGIQRGISCHHAIDAFTDFHLEVGQCRELISEDFRRYAGIILDVFFDYLLAQNWSQFTNLDRQSFISSIYQSFAEYNGPLPDPVPDLFERLVREDWLTTYTHLEGVELVLDRISRRLQRKVNLAASMEDLLRNYDQLNQRFCRFFPDLNAYILRWQANRLEKNGEPSLAISGSRRL